MRVITQTVHRDAEIRHRRRIDELFLIQSQRLDIVKKSA